MKTFFHGWRRKWGCIALVTACLLAGAWARGRFYKEMIELRPFEDAELEILLTANTLELEWHWETSQIGAFRDLSIADWTRFTNALASYEEDAVFPTVTSGRWNMSLGNGRTAIGQSRRLMIPYSTSVPILTLLSAWLILWKPARRL